MNNKHEQTMKTDAAATDAAAGQKAKRNGLHNARRLWLLPYGCAFCVALAVYQSALPGRDAGPSKTVPQPRRCDKLFFDAQAQKTAANAVRKRMKLDMDRSTLLKVGAGILLVAVYGTARVMQDRPPVETAPPATENAANTAMKPATAPDTGGASKGDAAGGAVMQLVKKDLKVGKGAIAKAGDSVTVHYRGTLTNGAKFDASYDRNEPFVFSLGQGQVIKGWDEGVAGMKVGGKRKLTVPSDMAYGPAGRPPTIPPDSTLVFEVELLKVN